MWTRRGDSVQMRSLAQQHNWHAAGCDAIEPVFLDALIRHHCLKIFATRLPRGMVDARSLCEDHLAAQVGSDQHADQADEADNRGGDAFARSWLQAQDERDQVEQGCCDVEQTVIETDGALRTIRIAPVCERGESGAERAEQAHDDGNLGGTRGPGEGGGRDQPDHVENGGQQPRGDRDIGDGRVQRVAEPRAVEQALEAARRLALRANEYLHPMLERVAESLGKGCGWRCGRFGRRIGSRGRGEDHAGSCRDISLAATRLTHSRFSLYLSGKFYCVVLTCDIAAQTVSATPL